MRLAYIDESYSDAFYFIGAVVVGDKSAPALDRALDDVAEHARATHMPDISGPLELHGHPMFHGKGDWVPIQKKIRARIAVYEQAMQAIGREDVHIFLHGLDRRAHHSFYGERARPEHDVVLPRLLERLNDFGYGLDEQILVIADEIDEPDRHRLDLQQFKRRGTSGHRSSRLENILDTLHFAPSHHSRLIQAADLVIFLHHRRITAVNADPRQAAAVARIWGNIALRVRHELLQSPGGLSR
jgi:hypothetical protein